MSVPDETGRGEEVTSVSGLIRLLLEDWRKREEELVEERARREAEEARHAKQMEEHLTMMRSLVERTARGAGSREEATPSASRKKVVLTKLGENTDIEAYLTTFERVMTLYAVPPDCWAVKLAPQLTGRAQQAYAAMAMADAGAYSEVKKAILRRYDIKRGNV